LLQSPKALMQNKRETITKETASRLFLKGFWHSMRYR